MLRAVSTARPVTAARPLAAAPAATSVPRVETSAAGVSGEFTIKKRFWSFLRPTYDVMADGERIGTIQRKLFSFTPNWTMKDASGQQIGSVGQKFFSIGFETTIKDEAGKKAGTIKQDILRSVLNPTAALRILDGQGQVVAKTDPVWLTFKGRIDLKDPEGEKIGAFSNKWFSLTEANKLELSRPMDKRLVLGFIASQIEVKKQEEAARREEEQEERERDQEASAVSG